MRPSARIAAATLACALILLVPLASTPVLPLIDFYNHIARYFVLSHLEGDAVLSANYAAAWALLPNLGLDAIATPLLGVVPPLLAAKLILAFILIVQFSGVIFLQRGLNRRADMLPAVLLVGLLYSYVVNWGFSNFLLGLGLVFWNLGLWVRLRDRPGLATVVCALGAVLIFFCHGFAFALYGVLLGGIEIGRWMEGPRRRIGGLAGALSVLALQAVIPVILFLLMPTSKAGGEAGSTLGSIEKHLNGGSLGARLDVEFWHRLQTILRVAESPYPLLDLVTFILTAAVIGAGLWNGWFRLHRWTRPALAIMALLCIITPPSLFGVGYVSDRLPLVAALMLVAGLASRRRSHQAVAAIMLLGVIALVRVAAITIGWSDYARHYADFQAVASVIPRGALVTDVLPRDPDWRNQADTRCQMYRSLSILLNGAVAPLFAHPSQQPLRLIGPIKQAAGDVIEKRDLRMEGVDGYFDDALARIAAAGRFDYVILCSRERLTRPLPPGMHIAAERGGITILKRD